MKSVSQNLQIAFARSSSRPDQRLHPAKRRAAGHPVRVWSYSPQKLEFLKQYGVEIRAADLQMLLDGVDLVTPCGVEHAATGWNAFLVGKFEKK